MLMICVGLEWFIDDYSKSQNRLYLRYNNAQIEEMYFTYNHLMKPIP